MEWPIKRCDHAAACVSGPILVIVGGMTCYDGKWTTVSDCWIHDLTTMKWKKVICVVHVYQILYVFGFGLQLPLPDTVTERVYHSLSAIQLSPHNVLLVAFGGSRSLGGDRRSDTVLIELSEYMNM